jgi:hypothetical protein
MLYDLIDIFIAGIQEEFEDTKEVVRIRKSTDRPDNTMVKSKRTKGQTTIHKTLHTKLKVE